MQNTNTFALLTFLNKNMGIFDESHPGPTGVSDAAMVLSEFYGNRIIIHFISSSDGRRKKGSGETPHPLPTQPAFNMLLSPGTHHHRCTRNVTKFAL